MFDKILEIVAPHTCCGCGQIGPILCEHCINDIIFEPFPFCLLCSEPVAVDNLCRKCRNNTQLENTWVVGTRKDAIKQLIDLYKFERSIAADKVLASLLNRRLPALPKDTIVTYVPTTAEHRRQRGYDTMERVAVELAKLKDLRVAPLIDRKKDIVQKGTDRKQRLVQQYEALEARKTDNLEPILLIDDVCTTGGTLLAATKRLKEVYSQPLYAAVIARQPLDNLSE